MSQPQSERRDPSRRPWASAADEPGVIVSDPGGLPTTRQMAIAAAERLRAYCTPVALEGTGLPARLPLVGAHVDRHALAPGLAAKLHRSETAIELARRAASVAGLDDRAMALAVRRNIALDARVAAMLLAGETVVGQPGGSLASFRRAKVLYGRTVLDHQGAHEGYGSEILRDEAAMRPEWAQTLAPSPQPEAYAGRVRAEIELADTIVVGSQFAARSFEGIAEPSKLCIIPPGVDADAFTPALVSEPHTRLRVLFAGAVSQRNGIAYLLEALDALDPVKFELTIAGSIGPARGALRHQPRRFRHITPRAQEMPAVYHSADVLVLPSLLEASPSVVLDAMASGLPVIVTPNAGVDAVRHGIEGFVVPLRSSEVIAARLEQLAQDVALRRRIGAAARARSLEFTWQAFRDGFRRAIGLDAGPTEIEERQELSA